MSEKNQYVRTPAGATSPVSDYNMPRYGTGSSTSFGSSSDFQHGSPEFYNYNVRTSGAYRVAYDLFSSLSDKQWLSKLESIASRSAVGAPSWTDDLGLTQDYQKRLIEAYNTAVADIQNLINSYYEYENTLPVTQVQQAADAGVNLAVSGDISGSSMTSVASSRSQLSGEGTDSPGVISGAVTAVSTVMSTVASVYKSISDVKVARDNVNLARSSQRIDEMKFVSGFYKQLVDDGFDMTKVAFDNIEDIKTWMHTSQDPVLDTKRNESFIKFIKSEADSFPYFHEYTEPDGTYNSWAILNNMYKAVGADSMSHFDDTMNIFAQYEMQTMLLNKLSEFNTAVYNENKSSVLDGTDAGLAENASNSFTAVNSQLNELKAEINSEFISSFADQWHKNKSPESRFALLKMVANMNLDDQSAYELIQLLGSPTLAKGTDQVISELVKAGGNIANKLSSFFDRKQKRK